MVFSEEISVKDGGGGEVARRRHATPVISLTLDEERLTNYKLWAEESFDIW